MKTNPAPWTESHLPPTACPYCNYRIDRATYTDPSRGPEPGDVSVCLSCAQILVIGADLTVCKPAPGEIERMCRDDPEIADGLERMQFAIRNTDRRDLEGTS